jgi:thioredoxin 1
MMSKAAATDTARFDSDVLKSDLPVLVDFWADWCGPCRMLAPTIDQIAQELEGKIRIFKVDVDTNQELANRFGIQGIPTLILFSGGTPQAQVVGVRSKADLLVEIERSVGVKP